MSLGKVETRGDRAWLRLELAHVHDWDGARLFDAGLPSRRVMVSEAVRRQVYIDPEGSEAIPDGSMLPSDDEPDQNVQLSAVVELIPATYRYDIPSVFQFVDPGVVRWAVSKYTPTELNAIFRLYAGRDPWSTYLTELMHTET